MQNHKKLLKLIQAAHFCKTEELSPPKTLYLENFKGFVPQMSEQFKIPEQQQPQINHQKQMPQLHRIPKKLEISENQKAHSHNSLRSQRPFPKEVI